MNKRLIWPLNKIMETKALSKKEACAAIVEMGHKLIEKHLVAGSWGNISCRTRKGIAITPSGLGYGKQTPADIVLVDEAGAVLAGKHIPSSETKVHLAIYKAYPEAGAVIHTHSIYASVLAALHEDVPAIIEDIVQICGGKVNCAQYAMTGTQDLADAAVAAMAGRKACLLANHGAVCWGKDLDEALLVAEILEKAAQIVVLAKSCGGKLYELDAADSEAMHAFYEEHYSKRRRGEE